MKKTSDRLKQVQVHPASLKHLKKGHPWVTQDTYTNKFPSDDFLLIKGTKTILLNDPAHPKVKARYWKESSDHRDFSQIFLTRLKFAFEKRRELIESKRRDNFYLVFGEADGLPGFFLQNLKDVLYLRPHCHVWDKNFALTLRLFRQLAESYPLPKTLWLDLSKIKKSQKKIKCFSLDGKPLKEPRSFTLQENGLKMKISRDFGDDIGIYTDMAGIREDLEDFPFTQKDTCLNLFSYTGIFGLFADSKGFKEVDQVDLSNTYQDWAKENQQLNSTQAEFKYFTESADKYLDECISRQKEYDLIICDPPSSSTDGKKKTNALRNYNDLLPKILKSLSTEGKAIVFLNTHSITRQKFKKTIQGLIEGKAKVEKELKMKSDCLPLKGFPEGDYLKGLVISLI